MRGRHNDDDNMRYGEVAREGTCKALVAALWRCVLRAAVWADPGNVVGRGDEVMRWEALGR